MLGLALKACFFLLIGVAVSHPISARLRQILLGALAVSAALSPVGCDKIAKKADKAGIEALQDAGVDLNQLTVWPPSSAGQYLAARVALGNDDLETANKAFQQSIEVAPDNTIAAYLAERALPVAIGSGDDDAALRMSRAIPGLERTASGQFALLITLREAMTEAKWADAMALTGRIRAEGLGLYVQPLSRVWILAGQQRFDAALKMLAEAGQKNPSFRSLFNMHRALVLDMANRPEAEQAYRETLKESLSLHTALLAADYFARHQNTKEVDAIYDSLSKQLSLPVSRERFVQSFPIKGKKINAASGFATVLIDLATVLQQENSSRLSLLYARIAEPELRTYPMLNILLGDIFTDIHDYSEARKSYSAIDKDNLFYPTAQWSIADTYIMEHNTDEALKIMKPLSDDPLLRRQTLTQIADLLRADKKYTDAITYYSDVIKGIDKLQEKDWGLFYARAICYESLKDWSKAEQDLQKALELNPNQPEVLNYLGYSWADKGVKLEQAYDYIVRAHQQTPNEPYIIDSVGWVLYQLGHFKKAVAYLEESIQMLPADPLINDHLGDAYWQAGREHEARFQWERALKNSTDQDAAFVDKLKTKLKNGLEKRQAHNGPLPAIKTSKSFDNLLMRFALPKDGHAEEKPAKLTPIPNIK